MRVTKQLDGNNVLFLFYQDSVVGTILTPSSKLVENLKQAK